MSWHITAEYECYTHKVFWDANMRNPVIFISKDEEIAVREEDCCWKWFDIDFGWLHSEPFVWGENEPDWNP